MSIAEREARTEFAYLQPTFKATETEAMAKAMHEDGFALIPGVLSPELVAQAREKIDNLRPFGFDSQGAMRFSIARMPVLRITPVPARMMTPENSSAVS